LGGSFRRGRFWEGFGFLCFDRRCGFLFRVMVDFDFGLSGSMGKGIIRCLCSGFDLSFFFKGEVGIAAFAIRRNSVCADKEGR